MIQFYDHLNILIKATEGCNLRCVYCFNKKDGYNPSVMRMETLEKLYSIMFPFYKSISIVWHGGEPTFAGVEFYQKALSLEEKYGKQYGVQVKNSMQTNATLLSDDFISLIEQYHISLGISYDGIVNDITRNSTSGVLSSIKKLSSRNIRPGFITVVSKKNINKLVETYEDLKKIGIGTQLNHYIEMDKNYPCLELALSPEEYVEKMYELFILWFNDQSCNIDLNPFREYIEQYVLNISSVCIHASCMRSWMCINSDGEFSACDKAFSKQYRYGNVNEFNDIREVYSSDGFRKLLTGSVKRREKCIESCEYYKYCEGGCNHSAFVEGELENNGGFSCITFRSLFKRIVMYLQSMDINENNMLEKIPNPYLRQTLSVYLHENTK